MWRQFQKEDDEDVSFPLTYGSFSKEDLEFVINLKNENQKTWNVTDGKKRVYIYSSAHPHVFYLKGNTPDAVETFTEYLHMTLQKNKYKCIENIF